MTQALLLDPKLLEPPGAGTKVRPDADFWDSVVEWASDVRVRLGAECHELVCAQYAEYGYPTNDIAFAPGHLQRDYQAALGRLLTRVLVHREEPSEVTFDPGYLGTADQDLALQFDVSGTRGLGVLGLATGASHWSDFATSVRVGPPVGAQLALCTEAGAELAEERAEAIRGFFAGKRIHIVGGRTDAVVVSAVTALTGLADGEITWLPCERARPPRNLEDRWAGLRADRDITVCITGRVGHATSEKAKSCAQKVSAPHLLVELPSQICATLSEFAIASISTEG